MTNKPYSIQELEQKTGQEIQASSATTLSEFMRYGQTENNNCQYLMEADELIGLKLRTIALKEVDFLEKSVFYQLKALYLAENELAELNIPAEMEVLEYLNIEDNETLQSLSFGGDMPQMKSIHASDSALESVILPDCPELETLDISRNKLNNFVFTTACPKLTMLDLSGNKKLSTLKIPAGFEQLRFLHLRDCGMKNLQIQATLPKLKVLDINSNQLKKLPADIILDMPLEALYAGGNRSKNIPWSFLEKRNSLQNARIWFQELRDHSWEQNKVVKLMISGNGNVGKTSLICALCCDEKRCLCEEGHDTTHGIQLGTWNENGVVYKYWDFGGQEVYHGTHTLFMSSDALQLIVYDIKQEVAARKNQWVSNRAKEERQIHNHPMPYWVETIQSSSRFSEYLVVQNKKKQDEKPDQIVMDYARERAIMHFELNAQTGYHVKDLPLVLKEKAENLPEFGMKLPSSWIKVRQFFIDNDKKAAKKRDRLITKIFFEETLCKGIRKESRALLLQYLHHGGYLYTHEKLEDQIIADQRWALDAIYKPLDRNPAQTKRFRRQKGEIYIDDLFDVFGKGYSDSEKWLFIDFMESCGLCFKLYKGEKEHHSKSMDDIYVIPEFLPEQAPTDVTNCVRAKNAVLLQHEMKWVNRQIIYDFICKLGQKTDISNIWRDGILVKLLKGWFVVRLNEEVENIQIWLDEDAVSKWTKLIVEEFPNDFDWKISKDNGQTFADFDLEKWQTKLEKNRTEPIVEERGEQKEGLANNLPDQPSLLDRETVLFLSANPKDTGKISFRTEHSFITEKLDDKECMDKLVFRQKPNISLWDLIDTLDKFNAEIIHFVGHGEEQNDDYTGGGLRVLKDDGRSSELINARQLGVVFKRLKKNKPQLKLVFLNACFTQPQAEAISRCGIYAIGTNAKISSTLARRVATLFYKKYAMTKNINEAVSYAATIETTLESKIHLYFNGEEIKR